VTDQISLWPATAAPARGLRPVHYLGSKRRLLGAIERGLDDLDPSRGWVCDLFSGSGVVASHLSGSRPVVAADIQQYARVLADALLRPEAFSPNRTDGLLRRAAEHVDSLRIAAPILDQLSEFERRCLHDRAPDSMKLACDVLEHGSILAASKQAPPVDRALAELLAVAVETVPRGPGGVMTRYYGGVYFSYAQALALDGLATAARELTGEAQATCMAAVMSTASDIVSSVGSQFAQPIRPRSKDGKPKRGALLEAAARRRRDPLETFSAWLKRYAALPRADESSFAVCGDYQSVLADPPRDLSVVYADPPYTRDHYSRYYHVLETLALGDEPDVSDSRGLYRAERHQSPFCIKTKAPGAFADLFARTRALEVPLLVSYSPYGQGSASRPRVMTVEQIVDLATEWFSEVSVASAGRLAHSKLNAERLNDGVTYNAEVMISCRV